MGVMGVLRFLTVFSRGIWYPGSKKSPEFDIFGHAKCVDFCENWEREGGWAFSYSKSRSQLCMLDRVWAPSRSATRYTQVTLWSTWRIIPVPKWLGSPLVTNHEVRPFGRVPTLRYLGDENDHHWLFSPLVSPVMILQAPGSHETWLFF